MLRLVCDGPGTSGASPPTRQLCRVDGLIREHRDKLLHD